MNTQLLHLEDPLTLEFESEVVEKLDLPGRQMGVILSRTYFYPTGGGQEHDTGVLGNALVTDVYKESDPLRVVHVVDRDLPLGPVIGRVDSVRRLRHMQHHSAQHLLSQCFLDLFDTPSISANINGFTPSTLDVDTAKLDRAQLDRVEDLANRIIYENRPILTYFVTPTQLKSLPLRWPPAVKEDIRIVEIQDFDYTPCGGTHCTATGMIGMVKIIKSERQGESTRLSFVAGYQALTSFRIYQEIVTELSGQLNLNPQDLPAAIARQVDHLKQAGQELQAVREERLRAEAHRLAAQSIQIGAWKVALAAFHDRPLEEVRLLSNLLKDIPGLVAALTTADEQKFSLVITCAIDTRLNARQLLTETLVEFGGRGGGNERIAQGGGAIPAGSEPPEERLLEKFRHVLSQ